ncbi:hypothetical protein BDA99DRAFT_507178 [Phascolomyces articulosus]|uniref:PB1 domain-containing protein n=1 Tax=Phascolomyces articulosus TaxID=60185 RepID=A0AAD5PGE8_9FUNG|nr:hypothetical protein BDA99DRAFT_507178 [Phascolomyces articulosus]
MTHLSRHTYENSTTTTSSSSLIFFILKPALEDGSPEETRRFEVTTNQIDYKELHQRVKEAFGLKCKFNLTFDEYNTTITMTDDDDLNYLAQRHQQEHRRSSSSASTNTSGSFVLTNVQMENDPIIFMKIVIVSSKDDEDKEDQEWYLKAARWIVNAGRVILIVAVPILHVFGPALAERLPPPYSQIILAATAAARKMPELLGHPFSQALLAAAAVFATTTSSKKEPRRLSSSTPSEIQPLPSCKKLKQ